jgi:hypothetical protein
VTRSLPSISARSDAATHAVVHWVNPNNAPRRATDRFVERGDELRPCGFVVEQVRATGSGGWNLMSGALGCGAILALPVVPI